MKQNGLFVTNRVANIKTAAYFVYASILVMKRNLNKHSLPVQFINLK